MRKILVAVAATVAVAAVAGASWTSGSTEKTKTAVSWHSVSVDGARG